MMRFRLLGTPNTGKFEFIQFDLNMCASCARVVVVLNVISRGDGSE